MKQDFHAFLDEYCKRHPDDVVHVTEKVSPNQEVTALAWALAAQRCCPPLVCDIVGVTKVVTNLFPSRERIARLLGCKDDEIHKTFQVRVRRAASLKVVRRGPVLARAARAGDGGEADGALP